MLDQFQQALADLTASPGLVTLVRGKPDVLLDKYDISDLEWRRLISVVNQPGMECNCMLYRANRLAPVAVYLPELCKVLAKSLNSTLSAYWSIYPETDVDFMIEAVRFCEFVREKINAGSISGDIVRPVLDREMAALSLRLDAEYFPA